MDESFFSDIEKLKSTLSKNAVTSFYCQDKKYWLKMRSESKYTFWHRLQHVFSKIIPMSLLKPTVSLGGAASIDYEINQIANFKSHGFSVPEVVYRHENLFVLSDVGIRLQDHASLLSSSEKKTLAAQLFILLAKMHQVGLCYGRPAIKDMTYNKGDIYFLDFEENPVAVMPLAEAQFRDVLLLTMSISVWFLDDITIMHYLLRCYLNNAPSEVKEIMQAWSKTFKRLFFLLKGIHILFDGKDLRKAKAAFFVMSQLENS